MAKIFNLNEKEWGDWVATRPPAIQELCKKLPPNRLFLMKNSGHKVTIYSYHEDNTVTVNVTGEYNAVVFERHVFGIKPDDLEECDFPDDNEPLGTAITDPNDVKDFIEKTRSVIMKAKNSK